MAQPDVQPQRRQAQETATSSRLGWRASARTPAGNRSAIVVRMPITPTAATALGSPPASTSSEPGEHRRAADSGGEPVPIERLLTGSTAVTVSSPA